MKKIILGTLSIVLMSSCVSSKVHKGVVASYDQLETEFRALKQSFNALDADFKVLTEENKRNLAHLKQMEEDSMAQYQTILNQQKNIEELNSSYEFLLETNKSLMASSTAENRRLMNRLTAAQADLQVKEDSLNADRERFDRLSQALQDRETRVAELEYALNRKDSVLRSIMEKVSDALFTYDGKGLTITNRNGKIYVTFENALLFPSASWAIENKAQPALAQLAKVLAENPELSVTVEGHTDSDAFRGRGEVRDNWDLSVMRSTAIVKALSQSPQVNPKRITAAGRSEYVPVADNDTPEGKAQNRRIEIIISPDYGKLADLISEVK